MIEYISFINQGIINLIEKKFYGKDIKLVEKWKLKSTNHSTWIKVYSLFYDLNKGWLHFSDYHNANHVIP
jgi:hypothetical protein